MARPKKFIHPVEISFTTELTIRDAIITLANGKSTGAFLNEMLLALLENENVSVTSLKDWEHGEWERLYGANKNPPG